MIFYHHGRDSMTEADWQERAKGLLKAELKRRGLGYKQLADRLQKIGVDENDRNIAATRHDELPSCQQEYK